MSTWTNTPKLDSQTARAYDSDKEYDQEGSLYDEKQGTIYTNSTKNSATWSEPNKTSSSWGNITKN